MEPLLPSSERPVIFDFEDYRAFLAAMITYRRSSEKDFSISSACQELRRCSPTLVTLVLKGRRMLTPERVPDFARLAGLTHAEQSYLAEWVNGGEASPPQKPSKNLHRTRRRAAPTNHILKDWLNVFVKDAFRLKKVREDWHEIYRVLGGIANRARIDRALTFLLREGFLRRTLDGGLVENDVLNTTTDDIPNEKIRAFHRQTLRIASDALELYPATQRYANALVLPLDEGSYGELKTLIQEFAEKLQVFAETHTQADERLYQIVVHLSPTGGSLER